MTSIPGSTFISGFLLDASNPASPLTFEINEYTEMEWAIQATESASLSDTYYFRVSNSNGSIGTYSEFPTLNLSSEEAVLTQADYRWYEHNNQLTPVNPWAGLGENTAITSSNEPPGGGDVLRVRMSLRVTHEDFPAGTARFLLQYGERESNCSSIESWVDVGLTGSSSVWRGTSTAVLDGSPLDTLLLFKSDVAGTFEEENPSALNPNLVSKDEYVEYDWVIQNNGASAGTSYCFRMVNDGGEEFGGGYENYPILTTADFTPRSSVWRWYGDAENVTPAEPLSLEGSAPTDIDFDEVIKLRVVVDETANVVGENVKFRLQFSESSSFSSGGFFVEEIESCEEGRSLWCYADGGGEDNAVIPEALLSTADSCVGGVGDGCGTHNESGTSTSTFSHQALASTEYEFTIRHAGALANTTYFFRLIDANSNEPVASLEGEGVPSLSTHGATLTFSISGVGASVLTEGVVTDIATTPMSIPFGSLPFEQRVNAAHRKTIETNAPNGFSLFMFKRGPLMSPAGHSFEPILGSNESPLGWNEGCTEEMDSCYGYHAGDDILGGGSTRFAPNDSYAAFEEVPREIAFSSTPVRGFSIDTVISIQSSRSQFAGNYRTGIVYILVPSF